MMRATASRPWAPSQWGPVAWRTLHTLATVSSPKQMQSLMTAFVFAAPCVACSEHIQAYLLEHDPIDYPLPERFLFDFHNVVNKRLGKTVLTTLPKYPTPLESPFFCSDIEFLVESMQSRRTAYEIQFFLHVVRDIVGFRRFDALPCAKKWTS